MNTTRFLKKLFLKGNEVIRNVAEKNGFIRALYKALINKDQGPRLGSFFRIIGKDRLEKILSVY